MRMTIFVLVLMVMIAAIAVGVLLGGGAGGDVELHAFDVLPLGAVVMHVEVTELEFAQFPFERARLDPEIDEGADHHVAADSGNAVKIESFHARL